jgi:NAD(P)H dehydrogenase (quinone)
LPRRGQRAVTTAFCKTISAKQLAHAGCGGNGNFNAARKLLRAGTENNIGQETTMTIAVIGATGNTGRAVVKELKALGQNPVCVVRNADKAHEVLGADAKIAIADLNDRAALEKALASADTVFVLPAIGPQMAEQQNNVIDATLHAGAKYLVRLSAGHEVAKPDSQVAAGRVHYAADERLRNSNIGWVILRPGLFMQNVIGQAASIKSDSKIVMPYAADFPLALIDVRDSGAVAARILVDPAPHGRKTYVFTGATTNYGDFVAVFSRVLGRKIAYVPVTVEQNEAAMKARNMPDWLIAHLVGIARIGNAGGFSTENTQPIRDIVKRDPITTKQFVEDFKALFV